MSLHVDLLHQAEFLARRERQRPRQASLRRAISAAYYALFHLLIYEASRMIVKDARLINTLIRLHNHGEVDETSKAFAKGDLPKTFHPVKASFSVPLELKSVAQAFVDLRQARHDADYNLGMTFTRSDVFAFIDRASEAFQNWKRIRRDDIARIYLASFLIRKQLDKSR